MRATDLLDYLFEKFQESRYCFSKIGGPTPFDMVTFAKRMIEAEGISGLVSARDGTPFSVGLKGAEIHNKLQRDNLDFLSNDAMWEDR